jgi:hypothetical protein
VQLSPAQFAKGLGGAVFNAVLRQVVADAVKDTHCLEKDE